jgi:MFS family permease
MFAHWYCYDVPAALSTMFMGNGEGQTALSAAQFGMLYSGYAYPNLFVPLFGGALIDRVGLRRTIVVFSAIVCLGQSTLALGAGNGSYATMLLGQVLCGVGGESFGVAVNTVLSAWFSPRQLPVAQGIKALFGSTGCVLVDIVALWVAERTSFLGSLWFSAALCGVGAVCAAGVAVIDARNADGSAENPSMEAFVPVTRSHILRLTECASPAATDGASASLSLGLENAHRDGMEGSVGGGGAPPPEGTLNRSGDQGPESESTVRISDLQGFPVPMFLLAGTAALFSAALGSTYNMLSDFLSVKYYADYFTVPQWKAQAVAEANYLMMVPFSLSAILSPVIGLCVGKRGRRVSLLMAGCALMVVAQLQFLLYPVVPYTGRFAGNSTGPEAQASNQTELGARWVTEAGVRATLYERSTTGSHEVSGPSLLLAGDLPWYFHPVWPLCMLGLSYACYAAAMWSVLVFVVPAPRLGTAFGFITVSQNVGLAVMPQVVGALLESNSTDPTADNAGYLYSGASLLAAAAGALLLSALLLVHRSSRVLDAEDPEAEGGSRAVARLGRGALRTTPGPEAGRSQQPRQQPLLLCAQQG